MANIVSVNLEKELEDKVVEYANEHGISKSQAINELIKKGLNLITEAEKSEQFGIVSDRVLEEIAYSTIVLRKTLLYWILNNEMSPEEWEKIKKYSREQAKRLMKGESISNEENDKLSSTVHLRKH